MPKSQPHSKKGSGEPAPEPPTPDSVDVPASDLRAQVAQLAEQVRRLGDRAGGARSDAGRVQTRFAELGDLLVPAPRRPRHASSAVDQPQAPEPSPAPQEPPSGPVVQTPVADGGGDGGGERGGDGGSESGVESAAESAGTREGGGGEGDTFADRSSRLVGSVLALAELAAIEIRTGAEIEAAAMRARSRERLNEPSTGHLLALLERQRQMLAALAAQTDRLERAGAVLRAQIRALEAERDHIAEMLESGRRTP